MNGFCTCFVKCLVFIGERTQQVSEISGGAISPVSWICTVAIEPPLKMVANMNVSTMEGHLLKSCNLHKYTSLPHTN